MPLVKMGNGYTYRAGAKIHIHMDELETSSLNGIKRFLSPSTSALSQKTAQMDHLLLMCYPL